MQIKIDNKLHELISFSEQVYTTRISYVFSMLMSQTDINIVKSATEFDIISGDMTTHYDGVEFDKYSINTEDIITYTMYKEIGKRVDGLDQRLAELEQRLAELEQSQADQDDILIDLLEKV